MPQTSTIAVYVTPRAGKNQVVGKRCTDDGMHEVLLRVTAAPDAGKANEAVCKLLAKELGIPKSHVSIKRGESSRHKIVELGLSQTQRDTWLSSLKDN